MAFKTIVAGADPLNTDLQQLIDALTGKNDVGALSLFAPIAAPGAPTVAVNATAGNLNGAYLYKVTLCTGYVDGDGTVRIDTETNGGTTSASVSPASQQVNLTAIPVGPAGTVARRIYRTAAGGADGTQKLVTTILDNSTTAYTDNTADGSRGAAVPTANSTGTVLTLDMSQGQANIINVQPDQTQVPASPGKGTLLQVLGWLANRIKAVTGGTNWWDAPVATLSTIWAKFNASTGHKHTGAVNDAPILPAASITQGAGSGLNADMLDGLHSSALVAALSGGTKIQSGGPSAATVTFPVAFSTIIAVVASENTGAAGVGVGVYNLSTTGFSIGSSSYYSYWIAIGT